MTGTFTTNVGSNSAHDCQGCSRGRFMPVDASLLGSCEMCARGQYQDLEGQQQCKHCEEGKHSSEYEATDAAACVECAPGQNDHDTVATTACVYCDVGRYQDNPGSSSCIDCQAGKYSSSVGATVESSCEPCSRGQFDDDQDTTTVCVSCPQHE